MRTWHLDTEGRSANYMSSLFPTERVVSNVIACLGLLNQFKQIDADQIQRDFDDLLPLCSYFISNGTKAPLEVLSVALFKFKPGCTIKKLKATAHTKDSLVDVAFRHNALQLELFQLLVNEFGKDSFGTELPTRRLMGSFPFGLLNINYADPLPHRVHVL